MQRGPWERRALLAALVAMSALAHSPDAGAVFSGEMSPRTPSGDTDYAAGMAAWDQSDWRGVVQHMGKVVERRPHHDNAWSRLGYAQRKLGRYEASLNAYGRALSMNPHHRGAMEYLGEAYLDLGRLRDAQSLLTRLEEECRRVAIAFSDGDFSGGCEEHGDLKAAIRAHEQRQAGEAADKIAVPIEEEW